jgi:uncharacterized protein with GYD domain
MLACTAGHEFNPALKGGNCMPSYLIQLPYQPETLAGFIKKPTDRTATISKLVEKIGGKLLGLWMAFGEYDAVVLIEGGDNVSAAACSIAVSASGAFKAFKTTPLLTVEESLAAMTKAGNLSYKPPNAKKK